MAFIPGGTSTTKPNIDYRGYVPPSGDRYATPLGPMSLAKPGYVWDPLNNKYVKSEYVTPGLSFGDTTQYIYGGGNAIAGGGSQGQVVYQVAADGSRQPMLDPVTGKPVRYGDPPAVWANVEAFVKQYGGYPLGPPDSSSGGGGGGGYSGGGGGGGGGATYYPQFDYNRAQGRWNRYITQQGFGNQDRQGDWARQYFQQSMLDFNTNWDKKHPAQRIPKEGTTDSKLAPDIAQNVDYNRYLKRAFGNDSLQDIYAGLSGSRRGDQYNRYAGNGRTLAWG